MFTRNNSSDDSDALDTSYRSNYGFRVRVCLRRYFQDVRARAVMVARPARRVRWLQRRIRAAFALPGSFCLRAAGHLLPPAEPLRVLRADELVEVIPLPEAASPIPTQHIDTTKLTEAVETQVEEETFTPSLFNGDNCNRSYDDNQCKDRNPTLLSKAKTELPSTAEGRSCLGSVEDESQAMVADVNSCDKLSLPNLKRRALELLETYYGHEDSAEAPPTRARRRLRRRPRRARTPCLGLVEPAAPTAPTAPATPTTPTATAAPSGDVARNEDASSRKARMVHSLDLVNT